MDVILAGYNIDVNTIEELKNDKADNNSITPEIISAAYARISRDPRPVNELRAAARNEVEKARQSNETIVFGLGHSSVAEHAVFNFDVLNISRFAIEELEHFRLASFTEKSQRYITLAGDFIIPKEIQNTPFADSFKEIILKQNDFYFTAFEKIKDYVFDKHKELAKDTKNTKLLEGLAKEDARYITALATMGQLGMTVNARELELMIRRFSSHKLEELRELGTKLYDTVKHIAPSLVKYTNATPYDIKTYAGLKENIRSIVNNIEHIQESEQVELVHCDVNTDNLLIASLLAGASDMSFYEAEKAVINMTEDQKKEFIKQTGKYMQFFDKTLREYEYPGFIFELVVSASCFAQLKRHRMATITTKPYNCKLGITIPDSIIQTGLDNKFKEVISDTEKVYNDIYKQHKDSAQYILTNAHKRRVLIKINAREMYHVSRLREDAHAQWDIRNISKKMSEKVKEKAPLTAMLLCGKDEYKEKYEKVYGKC
ncbi:FAD-dependent thymidylate synthase [bacterium]